MIGIIPARSGSKGIKDKNIQPVGNKSLLEHAVYFGLQASLDDLIISTDSQTYMDLAVAAGARPAPLRSGSLADDHAKTVDVVLDVVARLDQEPDVVVLLQPTAPIRTLDQLSAGLQKLSDAKVDAVVAVSKLEEPHPHKLQIIDESGSLAPFMSRASDLPRQQLPPVYRLAGSLYMIRLDALKRERTFIPEQTAPLTVDDAPNVDHPHDLILLQQLVERGLLNIPGN